MQTDRQRQRGEAGRAQLEEAVSRLEGLSVMMRGRRGGGGAQEPPEARASREEAKHCPHHTHTHTAGYEAIFHFILLPPPPRSARPSPPSSSNTVRTRGRNTLSPCPGDSTPASQALLSLTPRMLSEPHDLWTLIFPERQSRPFLSSGLSGCLSPTHFSPSPPAPVF